MASLDDEDYLESLIDDYWDDSSHPLDPAELANPTFWDEELEPGQLLTAHRPGSRKNLAGMARITSRERGRGITWERFNAPGWIDQFNQAYSGQLQNPLTIGGFERYKNELGTRGQVQAGVLGTLRYVMGRALGMTEEPQIQAIYNRYTDYGFTRSEIQEMLASGGVDTSDYQAMNRYLGQVIAPWDQMTYDYRTGAKGIEERELTPTQRRYLAPGTVLRNKMTVGIPQTPDLDKDAPDQLRFSRGEGPIHLAASHLLSKLPPGAAPGTRLTRRDLSDPNQAAKFAKETQRFHAVYEQSDYYQGGRNITATAAFRDTAQVLQQEKGLIRPVAFLSSDINPEGMNLQADTGIEMARRLRRHVDVEPGRAYNFAPVGTTWDLDAGQQVTALEGAQPFNFRGGGRVTLKDVLWTTRERKTLVGEGEEAQWVRQEVPSYRLIFEHTKDLATAHAQEKTGPTKHQIGLTSPEVMQALYGTAPLKPGSGVAAWEYAYSYMKYPETAANMYWKANPEEAAQVLGISQDELANWSWAEDDAGARKLFEHYRDVVIPRDTVMMQHKRIIDPSTRYLWEPQEGAAPLIASERKLDNGMLEITTVPLPTIAHERFFTSYRQAARGSSTRVGEEMYEFLRRNDPYTADLLRQRGAPKNRATRDLMSAALASTGEFKSPALATPDTQWFRDIVQTARTAASEATGQLAESIPGVTMTKYILEAARRDKEYGGKQIYFGELETDSGLRPIVTASPRTLSRMMAGGIYEDQEMGRLARTWAGMVMARAGDEPDRMAGLASRFLHEQMLAAESDTAGKVDRGTASGGMASYRVLSAAEDIPSNTYVMPDELIAKAYGVKPSDEGYEAFMEQLRSGELQPMGYLERNPVGSSRSFSGLLHVTPYSVYEERGGMIRNRQSILANSVLQSASGSDSDGDMLQAIITGTADYDAETGQWWLTGPVDRKGQPIPFLSSTDVQKLAYEMESINKRPNLWRVNEGNRIPQELRNLRQVDERDIHSAGILNQRMKWNIGTGYNITKLVSDVSRAFKGRVQEGAEDFHKMIYGTIQTPKVLNEYQQAVTDILYSGSYTGAVRDSAPEIGGQFRPDSSAASFSGQYSKLLQNIIHDLPNYTDPMLATFVPEQGVRGFRRMAEQYMATEDPFERSELFRTWKAETREAVGVTTDEEMAVMTPGGLVLGGRMRAYEEAKFAKGERKTLRGRSAFGVSPEAWEKMGHIGTLYEANRKGTGLSLAERYRALTAAKTLSKEFGYGSKGWRSTIAGSLEEGRAVQPRTKPQAVDTGMVYWVPTAEEAGYQYGPPAFDEYIMELGREGAEEWGIDLEGLSVTEPSEPAQTASRSTQTSKPPLKPGQTSVGRMMDISEARGAAARARSTNYPEGSDAQGIEAAFQGMASGIQGATAAKAREYAARIRLGEPREQVLQGLGPKTRAVVDQILATMDREAAQATAVNDSLVSAYRGQRYPETRIRLLDDTFETVNPLGGIISEKDRRFFLTAKGDVDLDVVKELQDLTPTGTWRTIWTRPDVSALTGSAAGQPEGSNMVTDPVTGKQIPTFSTPPTMSAGGAGMPPNVPPNTPPSPAAPGAPGGGDDDDDDNDIGPIINGVRLNEVAQAAGQSELHHITASLEAVRQEKIPAWDKIKRLGDLYRRGSLQTQFWKVTPGQAVQTWTKQSYVSADPTVMSRLSTRLFTPSGEQRTEYMESLRQTLLEIESGQQPVTPQQIRRYRSAINFAGDYISAGRAVTGQTELFGAIEGFQEQAVKDLMAKGWKRVDAETRVSDLVKEQFGMTLSEFRSGAQRLYSAAQPVVEGTWAARERPWLAQDEKKGWLSAVSEDQRAPMSSAEVLQEFTQSIKSATASVKDFNESMDAGNKQRRQEMAAAVQADMTRAYNTAFRDLTGLEGGSGYRAMQLLQQTPAYEDYLKTTEELNKLPVGDVLFEITRKMMSPFSRERAIMQRTWRGLGAPAFEQYIPAAAQTEMMAYQSAVMAGGVSGEIGTGPAMTMMRYQAQQAQNWVQAGRAANYAWGDAMQAFANIGGPIDKALGVFGPPVGAGAALGLGLKAVSLGVPALAGVATAALPVSMGIGLIGSGYAGLNWLSSAADRTAANDLAAYNRSDTFLGRVANEIISQFGYDSESPFDRKWNDAAALRGKALSTTPLGQLDYGQRAEVLNWTAGQLTQSGAAFEEYKPDQVLQALGQFTQWRDTENISGTTLLGQVDQLEKILTTGRDAGTYYNLARQLGLGAGGEDELYRYIESQGLTEPQRQNLMRGMGQWSFMANKGASWRQIANLAKMSGGSLSAQGYSSLQSLLSMDKQWLSRTVAGEVETGLPQQIEDLIVGNQALSLVEPSTGLPIGTTTGFENIFNGLSQDQLSLLDTRQHNVGSMLAGALNFGPSLSGTTVANAFKSQFSSKFVQDWNGESLWDLQNAYKSQMRGLQMAQIGNRWADFHFQYGYGPFNTVEDLGGIYARQREAQFSQRDLGYALQEGGAFTNLQGETVNFTGQFAFRQMALDQQYGGAMASLGIQREMMEANRGWQLLQRGWSREDLTTSIERGRIGFSQQREDMALTEQRAETQYGWQLQDYGRQRQSFALQKEQTYLQRQWAAEDLSRQRGISQMQFGWQMEDYDESIRFASGRERKQLIKQRERAVTMQNVEEESMDIQESRAQELYDIEDRRFKLEEEGMKEQLERLQEQRRWQTEDFETQRKRFEEQVKWQEEDWQKQEKRFEERTRYEDVLYGLQRRSHEQRVANLNSSHALQLAQLQESITAYGQQKIIAETVQGIQDDIDVQRAQSMQAELGVASAIAATSSDWEDIADVIKKAVDLKTSGAYQQIIDILRRLKEFATMPLPSLPPGAR